MWRSIVGLSCLCLAACGDSGREPIVQAPPLAPMPGGPRAAQAAEGAAALNAPSSDSAAPVKEQVIDWWRRKSDEEFEVLDVQAVHLLNREKAYLAAVVFDSRARHPGPGAVLVRPGAQDVIEILPDIGSEFKVLDLDGDGVSEIVSRKTSSSQGTTTGEKYILHLQDATPRVLHKAGFKESSRTEADGGTSSTSTTVEWKFSSEGNTPLLLERSLSRESLCPAPGNCQEKSEQQSSTYRYVDQQFLKSESSGTPK